MQIKITGGTKKLRAELEEAARFYGNILLHGRTFKSIVLDIDIHKKYDLLGECEDDEGGRRPRFFTINLRRSPEDIHDPDCSIFKTLAHEMVHLKQFALGELASSGVVILTRGGLKMATKWQGQVWRPNSKQDPYYDSPWEVEAYGREVGLYKRWVVHKEK